MDFKDILNKYLAPEGQEFKFSKTIIDDPQNEWDEIMNIGGGQPTYTLQDISKKQGLTSAPPSVYNRPDPRDMGPKFIPVSPPVEAVGMPQILPPILSGPGAQPPLEGTLEPRRPALSQTRPALERPPLEGEVVRKSLGGPSGTRPALPSSPALPQPGEAVPSNRNLGNDPSWVLRLLKLARAPVLAAVSPRLLADDTYMDGMMGGPFEGFSFVPPPDYTLGGMLRPQSFDSVNDMLLNQYLEGIDPYAQLLYSRRINGLF